MLDVIQEEAEHCPEGFQKECKFSHKSARATIYMEIAVRHWIFVTSLLQDSFGGVVFLVAQGGFLLRLISLFYSSQFRGRARPSLLD